MHESAGQLKDVEKRLADRSEQLEQVNKELEHLVELKDRFLSLATHDIRTPITTMKLAVTVLESKLPDDVRSSVRKPLDILQRNLARVEGKIEEYRLITRLGLDRLHLTFGPVDLNACVQDAIACYFPGAISRGIDLDAELDDIPPMRGDAARIGQLTRELIESSLERIEQGQRILVRTEFANDGAWIRVTDNGPVMPEEDTRDLLDGLDRFVPTRQTRVPIFAAHQIASAHGGCLEIKSDEHTGTTFSAWLPSAPPEDSEVHT